MNIDGNNFYILDSVVMQVLQHHANSKHDLSFHVQAE